MYLDADFIQKFARGENIFLIGVSPQCKNGRVFEQNQRVATFAAFMCGDERMLKFERVSVRNDAEIFK
jgi:hypothetical protein